MQGEAGVERGRKLEFMPLVSHCLSSKISPIGLEIKTISLMVTIFCGGLDNSWKLNKRGKRCCPYRTLHRHPNFDAHVLEPKNYSFHDSNRCDELQVVKLVSAG